MSKRRLPVIQPSGDDQGEQRPAWQWVFIGGVAMLLAWGLLTMLAGVVSRVVVHSILPQQDQAAMAEAFFALDGADRLKIALAMLVPQLLALGVAALLGGLLVGRFGGDAGRNEAMTAGMALALIATAAVGTPDMVATMITAMVFIILAGLSARGGAIIGLKRR